MQDNAMIMLRQELSRISIETKRDGLGLDDLPCILNLYRLAKKITDDKPGSELMPLQARVRLGNAILHPLTLGRAQWLEDRLTPWFGASAVMGDLALAWLLARALPVSVLWRITTKAECAARIKRWWRNLDCTLDELRAAVVAVIGDVVEDGHKPRSCRTCQSYVAGRCACEHVEKLTGTEFRPSPEFLCGHWWKPFDKAVDYVAPLIATMCRVYGQSPEYWLWTADVSLVMRLFSEQQSQQQAEAEAVLRAGGKQISVVTQKMEHVKEFRLTANELRRVWQSAN